MARNLSQSTHSGARARKTVVGFSPASGQSANNAGLSGGAARTGAGGKGLGRSTLKRHRKILKDNIQGITKPAIRRLARRGGVKRISQDIYQRVREALKTFLEEIIRVACLAVEYRQQKTVTTHDIVWALDKRGNTLYGFGHYAK
ncbi:Putative histone H4, transcription factor CBF/NF-Y/archaeal histone domain, histone-fold [Septoria linicola]|uniref:Histone H4 n=1 Tax=Septoria linicola TaxID=215465 RepID=A0A9Q9AXQ7_9PEZI|nr:putative histone H4, transcription factor CBF/NF-Y/archaeal histone domain, histone-fold [Septoria linicola]USW56994.1 Putative histone H4, transcription factor CBF/NF-Y/archaeal histone domain, histone-fold [Septoria linicola]